MNPVSVGDDLVERLKEIYETGDHERLCQGREYSCTCGFDDRTEATAREAAARIIAVEAERDALIEANNAVEIDAGLTSNGNLWRFWSLKAKTMVDRATKAEARNVVLEKALAPFAEQSRKFDEASMDVVGELAPDDLTPHTRFTHADLRAARAALTPEPS